MGSLLWLHFNYNEHTIRVVLIKLVHPLFDQRHFHAIKVFSLKNHLILYLPRIY